MHLFGTSISLAFVLFASLITNPALAAPQKKPVNTFAQEPASAYSYSSSPDFNMALSAGAINERFSYGAQLQLEWPVILSGSAFAFGIQSGFLYNTHSETVLGITAKSRAWTVPVLFSGKYKFKTDIDFIKPYLALGMGASVDHITGDVNVAGLSAHVSDTTVHFAILIRPGITLGSSQSWFVEIPFGSLFTDFCILPSVGLHF